MFQLGLTARTLETARVPVSVHGMEQETVQYPPATSCACLYVIAKHGAVSGLVIARLLHRDSIHYGRAFLRT